eukprot:85339-Chlamydomonas_euryale.AAC.1
MEGRLKGWGGKGEGTPRGGRSDESVKVVMGSGFDVSLLRPGAYLMRLWHYALFFHLYLSMRCWCENACMYACMHGWMDG